jgi:hypothetical protein
MTVLFTCLLETKLSCSMESFEASRADWNIAFSVRDKASQLLVPRNSTCLNR